MSNKMLIIFIGVMMVFMLGLGGGLFMMWNKLSAMETQAQASAENSEETDPDTPVPSLALGDNPIAKYMGSEEGMGHVFSHWPILFDAGGTGAVAGDYLYRDYAPNGNRNGQFGILRVKPAAAQ